MQVDEQADQTEVVLHAGQELSIVLPENPTTGYRWQVEQTGEPVCTLVDDTFEPPDPPVQPGQPGRRRWRFQAAQPGSGQIALASRRPWGNEPPARQFRLTVHVAEQR